mmetsp:Transcript_4832/g.7317  ORF Transcript_4832/g.7317 Transcript_4832/m.7317 type:complete len:147 (+) Transcript_4832:484-924(+)
MNCPKHLALCRESIGPTKPNDLNGARCGNSSNLYESLTHVEKSTMCDRQERNQFRKKNLRSVYEPPTVVSGSKAAAQNTERNIPVRKTIHDPCQRIKPRVTHSISSGDAVRAKFTTVMSGQDAANTSCTYNMSTECIMVCVKRETA